MLSRKASASAGADGAARRSRLQALDAALTALDPDRVVERGYAVVDDGAGRVLTSAAGARSAGRVRLRFADGSIGATVDDHRGDERQEPTPDRSAPE